MPTICVVIAFIAPGSGSEMMNGTVPKMYTKVLTARENAVNACHSSTGVRLVPAVLFEVASIALQPEEHFFVGLKDRKPNRYGWVTMAPEPFLVDSMIAADAASLLVNFFGASSYQIEIPSREWYVDFLATVARYPIGTPMSASWLRTRLPGAQRRRLKVHKVFFHNHGPSPPTFRS